MKSFIFSAVSIENPAHAELLQTWLELVQHLNPEQDILLVDNKSDPLWLNLVPALKDIPVNIIPEGAPLPPLQKGINFVSFPENVGLLTKGGRDGRGRAFVRGVQCAIQHNYDYAAHIEFNLLFKYPVQNFFKMLRHHGAGCVSCVEPNYFFMETGVCFLDIKYLKERSFIENYDWQNRAAHPHPEYVVEAILAPKLFYKRLLGYRDDFGNMTDEDVRKLDWIKNPHDNNLCTTFMQPHIKGWVAPSQRKQAA